MKIVFFGTSEVGLPTLEKLVQHHEVVGVVTSPDAPVGRKQVLTPSPVASRAEQLGLHILKPEKVKGNSDIVEQLEKLAADIYIVVSYGKILPKELIDVPPLKTLNIHFSLLPQYRGAAPIQSALKNGDTATGTTIFILDEFMDHGPVLAQVEENIKPDDTFTTLAQRMAEISAEKLIGILPAYQNGELATKEQNHDLATKAPMIKKEDGRIDWSKPAQDIYNTWRAYQPWPGIYTTWNGKLLKIIECASVPSLSIAGGYEKLQGSIKTGGYVLCGDNTALQLVTIQLEGGRPLNIRTFLNGNPVFIGSKLM